MEFMARERFAAAEHQAVRQGRGLAVAQAQGTRGGSERQHPGHRLGDSVGIDQLLTQQQQTAAFGQNRQAGGDSIPQRGKAATARRQSTAVELGVTTRQQHGGAVGRQRLVGQGTPGLRGKAAGLQQFGGFRVAEVKGGVAGDGDRQRLWW